MYLTGFNAESEADEQVGTPGGRANSCMERLLRDEKRRKEAKLQMQQKKEMELSRDDANNTFKPTIKTTKKSA